MAIQTLQQLKAWFRKGLKPTQEQFWDTWDSFWHKEEKIPMTSVENLNETLNQKGDTSAFQILIQEINQQFNVLKNEINNTLQKKIVLNTANFVNQSTGLIKQDFKICEWQLEIQNNPSGYQTYKNHPNFDVSVIMTKANNYGRGTDVKADYKLEFSNITAGGTYNLSQKQYFVQTIQSKINDFGRVKFYWYDQTNAAQSEMNLFLRYDAGNDKIELWWHKTPNDLDSDYPVVEFNFTFLSMMPTVTLSDEESNLPVINPIRNVVPVYTDSTLSGNGLPNNPLSVAMDNHFKIYWDTKEYQDSEGYLPQYHKICKWKLENVENAYFNQFFHSYKNLPQFNLQVTASSLSTYSPIGIAAANYELKFTDVRTLDYDVLGLTKSFADFLNSEIPKAEKVRWMVGHRSDGIGIDVYLVYFKQNDEIWLVAETVQKRSEPLPYGFPDPDTPIYEFEFTFCNIQPIEEKVAIEPIYGFHTPISTVITPLLISHPKNEILIPDSFKVYNTVLHENCNQLLFEERGNPSNQLLVYLYGSGIGGGNEQNLDQFNKKSVIITATKIDSDKDVKIILNLIKNIN